MAEEPIGTHEHGDGRKTDISRKEKIPFKVDELETLVRADLRRLAVSWSINGNLSSEELIQELSNKYKENEVQHHQHRPGRGTDILKGDQLPIVIEDLPNLPRNDLQRLASNYGIFGNLRNDQLIEELTRVAKGEKPLVTYEATHEAGIPARAGGDAPVLLEKHKKQHGHD